MTVTSRSSDQPSTQRHPAQPASGPSGTAGTAGTAGPSGRRHPAQSSAQTGAGQPGEQGQGRAVASGQLSVRPIAHSSPELSALAAQPSPQAPAPPATQASAMGALQEQEHDVGHDYAHGSPHIRHHSIRERVVRALLQVVGEISDRNGGRCRVVEVGAGHGTFTDHLLAAGAEVEVTEMSGPSADALRHRFRHNRRVTVVHDPDGEAAFRGGAVDAVVCVSVLHHIPDYLGSVERIVRRVSPGGAFVSFQDPMWYPRRGKASMATERAAYYLWRMAQGDLQRGLATRVRRLRGVYDETNAADMVEYHVVRQGVDEEALQRQLEMSFHSVTVDHYWSTQSGLLQGLGERVGPKTTFGLIARDRRGWNPVNGVSGANGVTRVNEVNGVTRVNGVNVSSSSVLPSPSSPPSPSNSPSSPSNVFGLAGGVLR